MQLDHALQELRLGPGDVLEGLPGNRFWQESDEIAGMACSKGDADLTIRLEAADSRPMAGARIDDHEWTFLRIDRGALRLANADEAVIDRPVQRPAVHYELEIEGENMRRRARGMLAILIAALTQYIEEQHRALRGIDPIVDERV